MPGEYIVTPVGVFHWGINLCANVHEAWNMTSPAWAGKYSVIDRSYCVCGAVPNRARIGFEKTEGGVEHAKSLDREC